MPRNAARAATFAAAVGHGGVTPPEEGPRLPLLHFRTGGLPEAEASAQWRALMAPLFDIDRLGSGGALPRGNLSVFVVGDLMVNRCTFNAQRLTRDAALIEATPDHLVLQFYRSGGFRGTIAGRPVAIGPGQVTVADLRHEIDASATASDTIGLSVPRALLGGIDSKALTLQLDAPRNRLLGGWMGTLPKRLRRMSGSDIPTVTAELERLLGRVFAKGLLEESPEARADEALLDRALGIVDAHLGESDLSPGRVRDLVGTSRATLYRLFSPLGGIMRHVQEQRLLAVHDVLSDPLDTRMLGKIAAAYGFGSPALLSRTFQQRFGTSPRDWRARVHADAAAQNSAPDPVHALWRDLGRAKRRS